MRPDRLRLMMGIEGAKNLCPQCESANRLILKSGCAEDRFEPHPWHRNQLAPDPLLAACKEWKEDTERLISSGVIPDLSAPDELLFAAIEIYAFGQHVTDEPCPRCSGTTQKPDEGVTQADLDRGEELDEKFGWSHTAKDAERLRKQAAEVHAEPDEGSEGWPGKAILEEISQQLTSLHNGTAPDRGVHYQDGWRHGVADSIDVVRAALDRATYAAKGADHAE